MTCGVRLVPQADVQDVLAWFSTPRAGARASVDANDASTSAPGNGSDLVPMKQEHRCGSPRIAYPGSMPRGSC